MASPRETIAEAFTKLKQSLSESDAYDFASTELKDVRKAVRDIDSEQRQRQSAQNLQRIEPFLRGLEKYAKVIEVLCNGTPYLPYVWAPIKLMLQLASQHRDIFEALLTAYADIGSALPRFDRYTRAFGEDIVFQNVLASIYSGILDFHQQAYKFFKKRAWNVLFLSLWTDFGARFKGIIDGLKKQRDFLDREASSIDMLESKESRNRAQEEIEQRQKHSLLLIEQNETILKKLQLEQSVSWLSINDQDQDTRFERLCRRRHDKTCVWIMKQAQIVSWLETDTKNPIVWLCGKPGAGKSVMCSYLVSALSEMPNIDVLYFFCASQDVDDSCNLVLRTIVLQLLRQHPELASLLSNEFISTGAACVMSQLRILIPKILETIPCARIVIDGIDEAPKETQKAILKELQTTCLGNNSNCKFLFSSRKEVHLAEKLARKPQVLLDGRVEVNSDIRLYIKHKIKKLDTHNTELLQKIESILMEKANGMFLWVHLVVEELRSCYSDWDLEESAKSLPKGLEAAYGRILLRIANERGAVLAMRILEWMACSYRLLKAYELLDGISFRVGSSTFNPRPSMKRDVLNLCRPLIEDDDQSVETVDFIHFSAKEFILNCGSQDGSPFIKSADAHFNIAFSCVAYLSTAVCLLPSHSSEHQRAAIIATCLHGLLPYANQFWIDHLLAYCTSLNETQAQVNPTFLPQLNALLQFQKPWMSMAPLEAVPDVSNIDGLKALHRLPSIRNMISNIIRFRSAIKMAETSGDFEKSPEDIALQACERDPSYLGILRHHYQSTFESLLDQHAAMTFANIQQETIRNFQNIFGVGAFTCRYLHCSRLTDGFNNLQQRDAHEAAHRRQFRCKNPSCVDFSTGFATRSSLNRHNKQYHQVIETTDTLSDIINKLRIRSPSVATDAPIQPVYLHPSSPPRTPLRFSHEQLVDKLLEPPGAPLKGAPRLKEDTDSEDSADERRINSANITQTVFGKKVAPKPASIGKGKEKAAPAEKSSLKPTRETIPSSSALTFSQISNINDVHSGRHELQDITKNADEKRRGGETTGPLGNDKGKEDDIEEMLDDEEDSNQRYCTCRRVSSGDMVACDDNECPYEWFHWECVGITREPQGIWICSACTERRAMEKAVQNNGPEALSHESSDLPMPGVVRGSTSVYGAGNSMPVSSGSGQSGVSNGITELLESDPSINPKIHQMIFNSLIQQAEKYRVGWQLDVSLQERKDNLFKLVSHLRLAGQIQVNPPTVQRMVMIAMRFEEENLAKLTSKGLYKKTMAEKMEQLKQRHNQNLQEMQTTQNEAILAQAGPIQQMAYRTQMQEFSKNQDTAHTTAAANLAQQMAYQMPMQEKVQNQDFQHLQHQIQASPRMLPSQHPPPRDENEMPSQVSESDQFRTPPPFAYSTYPPPEDIVYPPYPQSQQSDLKATSLINQEPVGGWSHLQNVNPNLQQQFEMQRQQQLFQQERPNIAERHATPSIQFTQEKPYGFNAMVDRMMESATEEVKANIRLNFESTADPIRLRQYQVSGLDTARPYYMNLVRDQLRAKEQQRQALAVQQGQNMQPQRFDESKP